MAKAVAVASQKGGVGKTTTAVHLAHYADAFKGQRVLVVDFDPQRNSTDFFLSKKTNDSPAEFDSCLIASALFNAEEKAKSPIIIDDRIHLIPADRGLYDVETMALDVIINPRQHLRKLDYDLVIIDTPPYLGNRLAAALVAADTVLTPFMMASFSINGIGDLMDTIQSIRASYNSKLKHAGILASKLNSRSISQRNSLAELREAFGSIVLSSTIAERVAISNAIDAGLPVWSAKKHGESGRLAATEFMNACAEIYERVMK